jgi:hypothetical protein
MEIHGGTSKKTDDSVLAGKGVSHYIQAWCRVRLSHTFDAV